MRRLCSFVCAGVAEIRRVGGVDREIRVDLNRLACKPLDYGEAGKRQIRTFNVNLPGGRAEVGGSEQTFGRWAVPQRREC